MHYFKSNFKFPFVLGSATTLGVIFSIFASSCAETVIKPTADELYAREFIKKHGVPSPDQDWNTFNGVTVNLNKAFTKNASVIRVYTSQLSSPECRLAADYKVEGDRFVVDLPKSLNSVYVIGLDKKGNACFAKTFPIIDKTINLTASDSRADAGAIDVSEVEKKKIEDFGIYALTTNVGENTEYRYYTGNLDADVADVVTDNKTEYPVFFVNNQHGEGKMVTPETIKKKGVFDVYHLKNVPQLTADYEWYPWMCHDLFDPKTGNFVEGQNNLLRHAESCKAWEGPGMSVGEEGGPVSMQMMYSATTKRNAFGYVYYVPKAGDSEEDIFQGLVNAPRYILIENASAYHNLTYYRQDVAGGPMEPVHPKKTELSSSWYGNDDKMGKLTGSKYPLVYYGSDYNESAQADFAPGTRIIFFVIAAVNRDATDLTKDPTIFEGIFPDATIGQPVIETYLEKEEELRYLGYHTRYSLPRMNKYFGHEQVGQGVIKDHEDAGGVFFVSFKWHGMTLMAVEDGVSDKDCNDIIFALEGVDTSKDIIDITPDEEPVQSAILACEDLGDYFDHDFNDLVLEVSHVAGQEKAKVRPLAAGGTLKLELLYNNEVVLNNGKHINEWFGESDHTKVINAKEDKVLNPGEEIEIAVDKDFRFSWGEGAKVNMSGFKLRVYQEDKTTYEIEAPFANSSETDIKTPQMILVNGDWSWPKEHQPINEAYPRFDDWVKHLKDPNSSNENDEIDPWESPNAGLIVDRSAIKPIVQYTGGSSGGSTNPGDPSQPDNLTEPNLSWTIVGGDKITVGATHAFSISCDAVCSVSISDNSIVELVKDSNSLGLKGLKAGKVTLTLTTQRTSKYKSIEKKFVVEVVSPLVMDLVGTIETPYNGTYRLYEILIPQNKLQSGARFEKIFAEGYNWANFNLHYNKPDKDNLFDENLKLKFEDNNLTITETIVNEIKDKSSRKDDNYILYLTANDEQLAGLVLK